MTLRKIAQLGHPLLRKVAREVSREELTSPGFQQLIDDLIETMRDAYGAGLAAPQIYESVRLCAVEVADNPRYPYKPRIPLTVLVNPCLTHLVEETFENFEGCLSVPNLRGRVHRCPRVRIQALDREGEPVDFEAKGLTAATFQHEVDHLDGVVFVDRVYDSTSLCTVEHFERFVRKTFEQEVATISQRWGF